MNKVYLVEDTGNSPGKIYAIFANEDDAISFKESLQPRRVEVVERSLFYGQPDYRGINW
jgi:hypothetical protein